MKKIFSLLLITMIAGQVPAQTEKFDMITYTPLKDWSKDVKPTVAAFANINRTTGGFCVITLYRSIASTGTAIEDFKKEWKERVAEPFHADADPKSESQTSPEGWTAITAASAIKQDTIDAYMVLTVVSGFGKACSILATFNDQSYLPQIDGFLGTLNFDKNVPLVQSAPVQPTQDQNTNTGGSIVGVWSDQQVSIANYVNPSGVYVGDASISTMNEYTFRADHTYFYRFLGMTTKAYYTETSGTYKVDGRSLTITPLKRRGGFTGNIHDEQNMLGKPETFEFYIGPNKWKEGPFLNLHKDGSYYMWSDYPYDYYTKVGEPAPVASKPISATTKTTAAKTNTNTKPKVVK